jgi:predicted ATPase
MHYADAQSIEVLTKFAEAVETLPIMIVIAYSPAGAQAVISPLLSVAKQYKPDGKHYYHTELQSFNPAETAECCADFLPNYIKNQQFERWINERTSGIPSLVTEYLRYFQKFPPFAPDGSLRHDVTSSDILPASIHAAFSKLVEQLSEEDRTTLALCSVEGMEATVTVVSALLNNDALTTVRKLRSLQRRTGIIRSTGAKHRYGAKTTVYEFTRIPRI